LDGLTVRTESIFAKSRQFFADVIILLIPALLLFALIWSLHELYDAVNRLKKSLREIEQRLARVEQRASDGASQ
jgi:uncharacterized membrane protein YqhA